MDVTVTIDAQELEKVHRRHEPFFSALLTIHYLGQGSLDLTTGNISLEFVKHFRVRQPVLDPDDFAAKVQDDADTLNDQTAREVAKHPEQKEPKEVLVRAFLKDATDLQEFVGKRQSASTRAAAGERGNPRAGYCSAPTANGSGDGRKERVHPPPGARGKDV